jgi:predicted N-acyltransferase
MGSSSLASPSAGSPCATNGYRLEIADRVADLNAADWDSLRQDRSDLFMDRRFIAAVENSAQAREQVWSALVYDGEQPVAAACLSLFAADAALLAPGWIKRGVEFIRQVFPRYLRFNILCCGLPVSASQNHLQLSTGADRAQVLRLLDEQMRTLARRHRAKILLFKEFDEAALGDLSELSAIGYLGGPCAAVSYLDCHFSSFDEYCAALRHRNRLNINRSQRKFTEAGMRIETLTGGEAVAKAYTAEVHRLYEAVLEQSEARLEVLPAEFFRELARQFPDDIYLILARHEDRIVGFACGLRSRPTGTPLFVGLDYQYNRQGDVYFNLVFALLGQMLGDGVSHACCGADSDEFKAKLGCHQRRNYVFVRATNWLRWLLPRFSSTLFPPVTLREPQHVFRAPGAEEANGHAAGHDSRPAVSES